MPDLLTYSIPEAAGIIPCRERWLLRQLRAGRFPARKIGREWRMTLEDIDRTIEICAATKQPALAPGQAAMQAQARASLAPESRRRLKSL